MERSISVFGATGSVGSQTLSLIRETPKTFRVVALSANKSVEQLAALALEFQAAYAVIENLDYFPRLQALLAGTSVIPLAGENGIEIVTQVPVSCAVVATVGMHALKTVARVIPHCKKLALANKESLVVAGEYLLEMAKQHQTQIIPVDSEHSGIFQIFEESNRKRLVGITLTASGGPFRTLPKKEFQSITPEMALKHPTWKMGPKITIDCATLVNKGLELIEAAVLFQTSEALIDVVIHPQSLVHALVSYADGSTLAHMSPPDMKVPIAYALGWPDRTPTQISPLNLGDLKTLSFENPDLEKFPALSLARHAWRAGLGARIIFNTINELAVASFLSNQLSFLQITHTIEKTLETLSPPLITTVQDVLEFDRWLRLEKALP